MFDGIEGKENIIKRTHDHLRNWLTYEIKINEYDYLDSLNEKDFVFLRTDEIELVGVVLVFNKKKIIVPFNSQVSQFDLIIEIFFGNNLINAFEESYYDFDLIKSEVEKGKKIFIGLLCDSKDINDFY